ncbi:MAG: rubrerythrin family protein [Chloroflexota bacterium]|jgi:rubrerythrin
MKKMTEENLKASFAGESQAHVKYMLFAEKAEKEGLVNVARLFRAASYAEQVHAARILVTMRGIGKTADNLASAIEGETYEFETMYPAFEAVAKLENEAGAARVMQYALDAEKVHAQLYSRARDAVTLGRDTEMGPVVVCEVCGYTAEGDVPEKCPLCGAPQARFHTF